MTIETLREITRMIKTETRKFCGGIAPTLDEINELAWMLYLKALTMVPDRSKVADRDAFQMAVYNTVTATISKEIL